MGVDQKRPDMVWLLFSPSGRISRSTYVKSILLWFALTGIAVSQMVASQTRGTDLALWTLVLVGVTLGWILSCLMLSVKRLHDLGLPGFWALALILPVVGLVAMLLLALMPPTGPNDYGSAADGPGPGW